MQYMLLIYEDEHAFGEDKDNSLLQDLVGKHMAFAQSLGATLKSGAGLQATNSATTVRMAGGNQTLHDGPFAETKEQLGGFYLVDVPDLDAALAIARKIPLAGDGAIEVRPLLGADDPGGA